MAVDAKLAAKKAARRRKKAAKRGVTTRHNVAIFETNGEIAAAKGLWGCGGGHDSARPHVRLQQVPAM